ncbi:MAG TPA: arsinothricin resistance N-acetyltransferase ArsN1 family B [Usitatibacter sp.]|nr:arsinothricin resistance N-acetyltransferase ArsN1 family B [Usitatibacter sp.]
MSSRPGPSAPPTASNDPPIRVATPSDARGVQEIYAPVVRDTVISFELEPPAVAEMERRIEATLPVLPWLVWEESGRVAGYVYASRHKERAAYQWSVDVTAYVHPDFRRRGVGKALYLELLRILRMQGYFTAYGGITLPNAASVALHESAGFSHFAVYRGVGYKFGRWHDVGWWQCRLAELAPEPAPPRAFAELGSRR